MSIRAYDEQYVIIIVWVDDIIIAASNLRWLGTVFHKMGNSRFRFVFLDCYFLMSNKEYRTDVKQRPKSSNLFTEATQPSLLWQR